MTLSPVFAEIFIETFFLQIQIWQRYLIFISIHRSTSAHASFASKHLRKDGIQFTMKIEFTPFGMHWCFGYLRILWIINCIKQHTYI